MTREEFDLLKKEKFIMTSVVSDSMVPVIMPQDKITIEVNFKELKRFDLVVIYLNQKLVCHYLWRMNKFVTPILLQTRSMAGHSDIPVPASDCLGKVVSHRLNFWTKLRLLIF